jgi:hypothetical protein
MSERACFASLPLEIIHQIVFCVCEEGEEQREWQKEEEHHLGLEGMAVDRLRSLDALSCVNRTLRGMCLPLILQASGRFRLPV